VAAVLASAGMQAFSSDQQTVRLARAWPAEAGRRVGHGPPARLTADSGRPDLADLIVSQHRPASAGPVGPWVRPAGRASQQAARRPQQAAGQQPVRLNCLSYGICTFAYVTR